MTSDRSIVPTSGTPTPVLSTARPVKSEGFANLVEALEYAALGDTGYNFYDGKGALECELSYAALANEAQVLARKLMGLGLKRGDRVAIVAETVTGGFAGWTAAGRWRRLDQSDSPNAQDLRRCRGCSTRFSQ